MEGEAEIHSLDELVEEAQDRIILQYADLVIRLPDEVTQFRVGIQWGTADLAGVDDVEVIYNAR